MGVVKGNNCLLYVLMGGMTHLLAWDPPPFANLNVECHLGRRIVP